MRKLVSGLQKKGCKCMGIEDCLFINADISNGEDTSVVTVYKQCGVKTKFANAFTGEDALRIYRILIGEEKLSE